MRADADAIGMTRALHGRMTARRFSDFIAWKLADQLRQEVIAFTAIDAAARDFKYRNQIRDASASVPRNIAEGFGRFRPGEFARFCEFALGSLNETQDGLIDGRNRGYLDERLFCRLWNLSKATERVTKNLMFYLKAEHRKSRAKHPRT